MIPLGPIKKQLAINPIKYILALIAVYVFPWTTARAQDTVDLPLHEEWDTYTQTSARNVGGWLFCKSDINDESVVSRANMHAYLTTGHTAGSGTVVATPYMSQVPDTFSFRIYGSSLNGQTAQVEFGAIPEGTVINDPSDICAAFEPYDTVNLSTPNQWQRTTVALAPYFALHGTTHRLAVRLLNSYGQKLYLDELGAWKEEYDPCSAHTTVSDEFWVTFIPNGVVSQTVFSVIATGLDDATITVSNPTTGWSTSANHVGGTKTYIQLPGATDIPSASAFTMGFHVIATTDISLFASNYRVDSWDICNILPANRLTSQYIVQDYPNNSDYPGGLGLVATEDNTVLTMILPCSVQGSSLTAGSTYTVTLNAGQSLALKCGMNDGFGGMTISSNDKPFALFQGHTCARVGTDDTQRGRDHLVEQAIPLDWWGKEFVVVSEQARTEGDRIRITAATDNTQVSIQGFGSAASPAPITLNAGQSYEYHMASNSAAYITSTSPIYVCKYLVSFDKFNASSLGDPASVDIPPIHNWLCSTTFPVHNCNNDPNSEQYITNNHHYLDIVTTTVAAGNMMLDGNLLPASQFVALPGTPYSYYHGQATIGAHTLENNVGPFYATVSGHARWVAYAFLTGMSLEPEEEVIPPEPPEPVHDTVCYRDTLCQGLAYEGYGFSATALATTGRDSLVLWRSENLASESESDPDTVRHYCLTLTLLPSVSTDTTVVIVAGDTLWYDGMPYSLEGDYPFHHTTVQGCDSVLTLHVRYAEATITASAQGLCPGEEVVLSAEGIRTFQWQATPPDPELESQQGQAVVHVHPTVTTVYRLLDGAGNTVSSVTVHISNPLEICVETGRPFIDFDHPILSLFDCTEGVYSNTWEFSDGTTYGDRRVRKQFRHPLPDTVTVTLTACTEYGCCVDTTLGFVSKIRSVWFPNVFTPNANDANNRFGCTTSMEVVEFTMTIFNRMGLEVWHTDDLLTLWDGTHDGEKVPQGAYVYKWYLKDRYGEVRTGSGTVTLLR